MRINARNDNIIDIEILNEVIRKNDIQKIIQMIDELSKDYDVVNMIILIYKLKGVTAGANIDAIKMAIKERKIVHKVAIISDNRLYKIGVKVDDLFTPWEEKYFTSDQLAKAWKWLDIDKK